jgi:hypothetical protein
VVMKPRTGLNGFRIGDSGVFSNTLEYISVSQKHGAGQLNRKSVQHDFAIYLIILLPTGKRR